MSIGIITILGLFLLGAFFWRQGIKSRPHALKKEPVAFVLRRESVSHELGEPLLRLYSKKLVTAATACVWAGIGLFCLYGGVIGRGGAYFLYFAVSCFACFYNARLASRRISVYDNAVVFHTFTGDKVFFLDEVERIHSYNIVSSFNKGVSWGWRLRRGEQSLLDIPARQYHDFEELEDLLLRHRQVETVLRGGDMRAPE